MTVYVAFAPVGMVGNPMRNQLHDPKYLGQFQGGKDVTQEIMPSMSDRAKNIG